MKKQEMPLVQVRVTDFRGRPLPNARVSLRPLRQRIKRAINLKFNRRWRLYALTRIDPGDYVLGVSARGLESQQREIQISSAGLKDSFILGRRGMPFYYRGKVKVPFEPPKNLLGVSLKPDFTYKQEREFLANARELKLEPVEVGEPVRQDNVRVFRFPPRSTEAYRKKIQALLSRHPLVRRVGPVISIHKDTVTFLTNELVVKFRPHVAREEIPSIAKEYRLEVMRAIPYAGNAFLLRAGTQASYDLLKTCAQFVKSGLVEYAEPNLVTTVVGDYTPNDYLFGQQPHHQVINSEGAWDVTMGDDDIIIAVVDFGCDWDHPDFQDDVAPGVAKVFGRYNFNNMTTDPTDSTHGTKSSGIATANADNSEGVAGVAPDCRLMPIRIPSAGTEVEFSDMYVWIAGFDPGSTTPGFPAALSRGADVISNSFGRWESALSGVMRDTLDFLSTYGRGGKGCVVVFSVGNNDCDFTNCPIYGGDGRHWAAYEKTIAVASSAISPPDAAEVKVSTSNFGLPLDVCAPGGGPGGGTEARTLSTTNVGAGDTAGSAGGVSLDYDDFGQTSCACPQVAGVAALMLSTNPDLTWVEVRQILRDTAVQIDAGNTDPVGQWVGGFSQWYGQGRIDAQAAVTGATDYAHDRDIVVRENLADVGAVPSGGAFYNSPDIWVRNNSPATDGAAALPASYGNPPPHQTPISGQSNWVYVRLRNIGTADSFDFYVRIYITHFPGYEFIYPDNYIPTNRPGDPVPSPMTPGTYLIGEHHYVSLGAGADDIINVLWPSNLIPPETVMVGGSSVTWHPCLLVEISPHDGPAPTGVHVWDNNNLAQKNISITYPDDDGTFATAAVMGNLANPSRYLELVIDRAKLPPQVQLYVDFPDPRVKEWLRKFVRERKPEIAPGCCRLTFLEETRLLIECSAVQESGKVMLTLPPEAKLELKGPGIRPGDPGYNFRLGYFKGREVVWLGPRGQTRIPVFAGSGNLIPVIVGGLVGKEVKPGNYEIRLSQLNPGGQLSGGFAVELRV